MVLKWKTEFQALSCEEKERITARRGGYELSFIIYLKNKAWKSGLLLRREGSNFWPSGYEPDELPLLYFAVQK